jgi:hypothetical protein
MCRDYEYRRLGTVSLLGGLDLVTGEIIPLIRDSHKSSDFIDFLKMLDNKYSESSVIKIVLDNHSEHTSKETRRYLESCPGRFSVYLHTKTRVLVESYRKFFW